MYCLKQIICCVIWGFYIAFGKILSFVEYDAV